MSALPGFAVTGRGAGLCVLLAWTVCTGSLALAQRDTPTAITRQGTGFVSGTVMDDSGAQPIRRALVTLRGSALPPTRTVVTDDDGRYAFRDVPSGRYSLAATKAAYLESAYGARRPGRAGITFLLQDGGRMTDVTLRMARGAFLEGSLRDAAGAPVSGAIVYLLDPRSPGNIGSTFFTTSQTTTTSDDRGLYRFFGLLPGEYLVAALLNPIGAGEIDQAREAEIDALLSSLERSRTAGLARPTAAAVLQPKRRPVSYAPTYYPGVTAFSGARAIRVATGEERVGLDFTLDAVPTVVIEGTVSRADGLAPSDVRLSYVVDGPRAFGLTSGPYLMPPDAQGRFRYTSVTPGHYTIYARSDSRGAAPLAGGGRGNPLPPSVPGSTWFARAEVDVFGTDVSGVLLELRPGVAVSGRVAFERTNATPLPRPEQVQVRLTPADGDWSGGTGGTASGTSLFTPQRTTATPDGTFVIANVGPSVYRLTSSIPTDVSGVWWLRSAQFGDRDLLDEPLDVGAQPIGGVVMTYTDRQTSLVGSIQGSPGISAPEYFIVLFPAEQARWVAGSRRIKSTRPGPDGHFTLRNLPGGNYLLGALTDLEPSDLEHRDFLEELAASAIRVTVREGEENVQDIRAMR